MNKPIQIQLQGFLRLPEVLKLIPVSKSTWWNGIRTGRFPKPVKLGPNTSAWRAEDIQNLISTMATTKERE